MSSSRDTRAARICSSARAAYPSIASTSSNVSWLGSRRGSAAPHDTVKITAVKPIIVDELGSNRLFVKVYTDEGLTGLGEGTLGSRCQSIAAAISENEAYLLERDPRDIEGVWQ